jgi:ATP-dependent exoDNAse (exonuclease V) beta subunit
LVNLILTQQNTVRKQLTKKQGFPSPSSFSKHEAEKHANYKMRGLICLEELANNNNLVLALTTLKHAPPLQFDADTWESLSDLIDLLPWLVAELNCIFQRTGQIDFNELTLGALRALGSDEQPTELAMKLDYQILHLLIDEFQDTSILQADLIRKIISEWQPGDGRSLFVVGDPMQSIYRFRNAEVSLFMQAQEIGIGHIPLKAISLSSNFRSDASLIDWVNTTFKHIFPRTPQQSIGGVPYSHAVAVRCDNNKTAGVSFLKPVSHTQEEALTIAEHIHHLRKDSPTDSIAILVRTRHQLKKLIPTLQKNGISFKATEIDYLGERREIQDLLVLTKALLHLADKTAWLALLRSPFLGFNLADCLAIAEESIGNIIWPAIKTAAISEEADARRQVVLPLLTHALKHIRRCRLSNWVAQTWQALGGRHTLTSSNELNNVRRFFDCLSQHEDDYNQKRFEQSLQKLFAEDHHTAENPVLVMTIHKSKGLEFDHVILPNINYGKSPQDSDLLIWSTISFTHGHTGLLLGILPSKKKNCQIYEYLRYLHTQQLNQETSRLFYVASTRAKKSLQLSTVSAHKSARSGSFMEKLGLELANENGTPEISAIKLKSNNQRIPLKKFTELTRPSNLPTIGCNNTISLHLAFLQSILGSVIHAYLHDLSLNKSWSDEQLSCALIRHGLPKRFLTTYIQTIKIEIQKILLDEKARWILSDKHKDAKSEYSLSEITPIGLRTHVVDRTFIDRGVRYIIDYKTSSPMGTSLYAFVNSELAHHESQLKRYETLFSDGSEPVISGLYFTNLQLWVPRVLE